MIQYFQAVIACSNIYKKNLVLILHWIISPCFRYISLSYGGMLHNSSGTGIYYHSNISQVFPNIYYITYK